MISIRTRFRAFSFWPNVITLRSTIVIAIPSVVCGLSVALVISAVELFRNILQRIHLARLWRKSGENIRTCFTGSCHRPTRMVYEKLRFSTCISLYVANDTKCAMKDEQQLVCDLSNIITIWKSKRPNTLTACDVRLSNLLITLFFGHL